LAALGAMVDALEVGTKLHAMASDGSYYPAEVVAISKKRRPPVKVSFIGYTSASDEWVPVSKLQSKLLTKLKKEQKEPTKPAKPAKPDYSGLEPGMKLQAESDGKFYSAEVITVNTKKAKPVKVRFVGYTAESDEWVGADRLRSKVLKPQEQGKKAAAKASSTSKKPASERTGYSLADQVARYARAQKQKNSRYLDINTVYKGEFLKGKKVLVVGASRGLGLEIAKELSAQGAEGIFTSRTECAELQGIAKQVITAVEVTKDLSGMAKQIKEPLDYVIYNAGYFPEIVDTLDSLQTDEALKQIDICAIGALRCVAALKAEGLTKGSKIIVITSQAGSAKWRFTQNKDKGGDYGHHMSRAACNIACVLMSEELKKDEIPVVMLHPGFNRTEMTKKFSHIWDMEGAVEPSVGAKRVLYEVGKVTMADSGKFINCEDGLQIPF